ncbi:MAG: TlpA family protein disulfide reductase [Pseudomonadota bacterium]
MRSFLVRSLGLAAILATSLAWSVPANALSINWAEAPAAMPALTMRDRSDAPVELDAFEGRVVVLNLWATWCAPCRREMPSLAALQAAFDEADVQVVALALDRADFEALDAFMAEVGASNLLVLRDAGMASARALDAPGLPATFVVDREGTERFRHFGFADWSTPEVIEALRALATEG